MTDHITHIWVSAEREVFSNREHKKRNRPAAKEDQATDRVHRIGQKRGAPLFKLNREGTLEEKISQIDNKMYGNN